MKTIVTTKKQREAFEATKKHNVTLYGGAIRGGKSYWLILVMFSYAIKYPNSRWAIIRANYTTLVNTLLVTVNQMLNDGLSFYVKSYQNKVITLQNGSVIFFFSENYDRDKELNRFKGLEVNGFGIDECNEIQYVTFLKCLERAGSWQHSQGCPSRIFMTCNPAQNWVKEIFYDAYVQGRLQKGFCYIPSKIHDNPYLSKEYLNSLEMLPEYQYEVFVNGNWDYVFEGILFQKNLLNYYSKKEIEKTLFDGVWTYVDVADEGKDSYCAIIGGMIGDKCYILDVVFTKENTDHSVPYTMDKIKNYGCKNYCVETNSMGAKVYRDMRKELGFGIGINTVSNKKTRIITYSAHVIKYFYFLNENEQSNEYKAYFKELTSYLKEDNNKHDDAPDATVGLAQYTSTKLKHLYK